MKSQKSLCLALGLGAIGKAVTGYAMTKAGVHVTYADIAQQAIDKVNSDSGYLLATADFYSGRVTTEFITGVDAVHVESDEAKHAAIKAEYIVSAVGPKGFRALLPRVAGWLKERAAISSDPLYYLIFENDHDALGLLEDAVKEAFGTRPEWLHISKCSIERMSKQTELPEVGSVIMGETFLPVIADRKETEGCSLCDRPDLLERVDDVTAYYYRKLLTNNLGHAVLSYAGHPKGYATTVEAMSDPEIYDLLQRTLKESAAAVCAQWGFGSEEMDRHLETLMLRFSNPGLTDELSRLGRDPIRKLSSDERIVYAVRLCYEHSICPDALLETLLHAVRYTNPAVERGQELIDLRERIGEEGILRTVCGAEGRFLKDAIRVAGR